MKPSSNLIFFGNERLSSGFDPHGAPTLQRLIDAGYHVAAVVAHYEVGTSRHARQLEIAEVAKQHNIPVLLPERLVDIANEIRDYKPAVGVLAAYGKLVPQSIIDIFPCGILNIHPSLLPQYRGTTPIEQAILDGASKTGVSIMGLVKQMDAGPIYAQAKIQLAGHETKQQLTEQLLNLGGDLLMDILPKVLAGTAHPKSQDESAATFTKMIQKSDGKLDFTQPAIQLERQIRAYAVWPKSYGQIYNKDIIVLEARVATDQDDGALIIPCANQTYLEIQQLIAPSGRKISGTNFMRGYTTI